MLGIGCSSFAWGLMMFATLTGGGREDKALSRREARAVVNTTLPLRAILAMDARQATRRTPSRHATVRDTGGTWFQGELLAHG